MKVVHVQHLLAQYDTLLRLGIDHAKGFSHEATFERLPAAPQRFAEGPSIEYSIRYQKEPPEPEPEIPALEVTPPSEVKPDMPGWLK